jgi:hypothetical protein
MAGMDSRRAAVLAVIGRYLLLPPITPDGYVDSAAPLPRWKIDAKLDTAAQCENARDALRHVTVLARRAEDPPMQVEIAADHLALCIQADAPRLKEK